MDNQEFRPFVDPSNSTIIKLPNFDTIMSDNVVKSSQKLDKPKQPKSPKSDKSDKSVKSAKKADVSNMGIDFEKLKETKGKRGYSLSELNKFVDEINRRGGILIKKNQTKDKIAEIIYNLQ